MKVIIGLIIIAFLLYLGNVVIYEVEAQDGIKNEPSSEQMGGRPDSLIYIPFYNDSLVIAVKAGAIIVDEFRSRKLIADIEYFGEDYFNLIEDRLQGLLKKDLVREIRRTFMVRQITGEK